MHTVLGYMSIKITLDEIQHLENFCSTTAYYTLYFTLKIGLVYLADHGSHDEHIPLLIGVCCSIFGIIQCNYFTNDDKMLHTSLHH